MMKRMAKRCPFFASTFVLNEVMQVGFFESFEPRFLWLGVVFHSQSHSDRRATRGIKNPLALMDEGIVINLLSNCL